MRVACILAVLLLALPGGSSAEEEVSLDLDVREATLSNGLRVLVLPREGNPRAACRLVFGVGSVNERPGITGISHLLEHMMFKGTERIGVTDPARDRELIDEIDRAHDAWKAAESAGDAAAVATARERFETLVAEEKRVIVKDELWRLYQTAGATGLNAFTSEDVTAYIVTLPANRVELFFWLESDRMANAVMREFHSEREVVKEERRLRTVNWPTGPFWETLSALHFTAHPYRWPVVGWMSDLDAMRREDLVEYRRVYYTPRNAVLCIAGGVDPDRMIDLAKRYFEAIPGGPVPPKVATVEPPQKGRKRYETTARAAPTAAILWHIPAKDHPDVPALEVLAGVMSSEAGRLHERLVRQLEIARDASANADARQYPSFLSAEATAAGGVDPAELLEAIEAEVRRLKTKLVSEEELVRVRNQTVARSVRSMRRLGWLSVGLAIAELHGDWRDVVDRPNEILEVTAEDVRRVARKYLTEENSTVGLLRRAGEEIEMKRVLVLLVGLAALPALGQEIPDRPEGIEYPDLDWSPPDPAAHRVEREGVANPIVYVVEDSSLPIATLTVQFVAGPSGDPVAEMGASLLLEGGTSKATGEEIGRRVLDLGGRISVSAGREWGSAQIQVLSRDLAEAVEILSDVLLDPAYRNEEIERFRERRADAFVRRDDAIGELTARVFRELVLGKDHPFAVETTPADFAGIDRAALVEWAGNTFRAGRLVVTLAGRIPEREAVLDRIHERFGAVVVAPPAPPPPEVGPPERTRVYVLDRPGATQGNVRIGGPAIPESHPDHLALTVMNYVLGGSGFPSRITQKVRSDEGLAYSVGSRIDTGDRMGGTYHVGLQTRSAMVPFAISLVMEEVRRMRESGVTEDELAQAKRAIADRQPEQFDTPEDTAESFAETTLAGRSDDWHERFRERVMAITREDVLRVARRHLFDPARAVVLVVGDREAIFAGDPTGARTERLADFGEIVEIQAE